MWFLPLLALALMASGGAWWRWHNAHQAPEAELPSDQILPVPPPPPRLGGGADYHQCLDMIEQDPQGALGFAQKLQGDAALHCQGLAQIELGNAEIGAPILMRVGGDEAEAPSARAAILGQASRAFLMIDRAADARTATQAALTLLPDDPDLRFDDALAAMAVHDFSGAVDDLATTIAADPNRGEALVARATAYRQMGQLAQALSDANAALSLDPGDPDALLERGIIEQRQGQILAARNDWQQVQQLAPDSNSADLATQNLALLEAAGD